MATCIVTHQACHALRPVTNSYVSSDHDTKVARDQMTSPASPKPQLWQKRSGNVRSFARTSVTAPKFVTVCRLGGHVWHQQGVLPPWLRKGRDLPGQRGHPPAGFDIRTSTMTHTSPSPQKSKCQDPRRQRLFVGRCDTYRRCSPCIHRSARTAIGYSCDQLAGWPPHRRDASTRSSAAAVGLSVSPAASRICLQCSSVRPAPYCRKCIVSSTSPSRARELLRTNC